MWEPLDITRGLVLLFIVRDSSVCCSEVSLRMLVTWHLCDVVFAGALGVPDLRSAADPGADRW